MLNELKLSIAGGYKMSSGGDEKKWKEMRLERKVQARL